VFEYGEPFQTTGGKTVRPVILTTTRTGLRLRDYYFQFQTKEVPGTGLRRVLEIMRIVKPRTTVVLVRTTRQRKDK
jgi:hypothetical protein